LGRVDVRLPASSAETFVRRMRREVAPDLFPGLATLLDLIERVTGEIRGMDREIECWCEER
jgi:hypothetical protein